MCGIAAIFVYGDAQTSVQSDELVSIRDHMASRGPDGSGAWYSSDRRVGLAHRRLSILDLSDAGAQPMASPDGRHVCVFNGEIYNFRELRAALERKGHAFRSQSDTEVLLRLYREHGQRMVDHLRGMFAFAIWDADRQGLFIARDPFGIKPLYYADNGNTLRVASQVKALLAGGRVDTSPEPAGHVGFFLWGHVPTPFTLYRGIRGLPAGCSQWIDRSGPHPLRRFCHIPDELAAAEKSPPQRSTSTSARTGLLRSALTDSVRHHLIADVPVGVFLSSGLDSTTLAALAAEQGGQLRTVTLGFEEFKGTHNDETHLAEQVARQLGAQHQTIWVTQADFTQRREGLLAAMDQPSCDGINSYFVSYAAAQAGLKVALSGLGGDEIFGGYPSFREIPRAVRVLQPFSCPAMRPLGRGFRLLSAPILRRLTSPKYAGLLEYGGTWGGSYLLRRGMFMPWELPSILDPDLVRQGWDDLQPLARLDEVAAAVRSPFLKVGALEMSFYMRSQLLRDTDWASMAHSVEVRTPLVDLQLLRDLAPLMAAPGPPTKLEMARAPVRPLPDAILRRPKTGFSIPVREWLLQEGSATSAHRGLRSWCALTYETFNRSDGLAAPLQPAFGKRAFFAARGAPRNLLPRRPLVLITDAFGNNGGIAKFNRDLLHALCACPGCEEVVALPRLMETNPGPLPAQLTWNTLGLGGKGRYLRAVLRSLSRGKRFDFVVCGHIHLLPLAFLHKLIHRLPVVLIIHGVDAWQPTGRPVTDWLARRVDHFIAVSALTRRRFCSWTGLPEKTGSVLPNCVEASLYGPGPKNPALLARYGLAGKRVILTLGRLASHERYKGFDEIMEALPSLARQIPDVAYLIVGGGLDRPRLQAKASQLGLTDRVVFAGRVPEDEKADHYRLADVYAMPSRGEGFGIVFLEAMACGVPVIGSTADASREALLEGELGRLVDPDKPDELRQALLSALTQPPDPARRTPPARLEYFSFQRFEQRVRDIFQ